MLAPAPGHAPGTGANTGHRHGSDPARPLHAADSALDRARDGWTIGLISHLYELDHPANDEVRASMQDAVAKLASLGARIEEVSIARLQHYAACKATIQRPEIREDRSRRPAAR